MPGEAASLAEKPIGKRRRDAAYAEAELIFRTPPVSGNICATKTAQTRLSPSPSRAPVPAFLFRAAHATISPMNRSRISIFCILLGSLAGCEPETEPAGLPQSQFIAVMVELRKAARGVQDTAAFAARKEQVLMDAGVTEAELRAYLALHIRDLDHLAAVWESINVRLAEEEPR